MSIKMEMPEKLFGLELSLLSIFVLPLLMLILFFLSLTLVIRPKVAETKKINIEKLTVEKKKDLLKAKSNYLRAIDEVELKKKTDYLEASLLKEKDAYVLVGLIREVAGDHGFYVQSFSVSPGEIGDEIEEKGAGSENLTVDKIPISFSVVGKKDKYLEFILALEKSLPIMAISEFEMSSSKNLASLDLMVTAFYVSEKKEYGKIDLNLNDLILNQEEEDLLATLFEYKLLGLKSGVSTDGIFVEYDREDPFF